MKIHSLLPVVSVIAAFALFGCEHADNVKGVSWNGSSGSGKSGSGSGGDGVSFSSLNWSYGGVNGSGASQDGVVIADLACSKDGMSFRYVTDMSAWGRRRGEAADYCCFFVQKSDGTWVGGKFDWISSSRTTRDFAHLRGYNGWTLSGVPNPCNVAFLILNHDCKRRSNVISGTWTR